jgi:hypothetical protein
VSTGGGDALALAAMAPNRVRAQFANGVQGYVDDRLADRSGWVSLDPNAVTCPVVVLHGTDDTIVGLVNAQQLHAAPDRRRRIGGAGGVSGSTAFERCDEAVREVGPKDLFAECIRVDAIVGPST